ncbi:MAG: thioredoxin-dependent thiol peroxidase [Bryobacteraceae bacterium]|nr:thioredoxin-dependent thiol peroxidase [Bryobacteraceae bacterium]
MRFCAVDGCRSILEGTAELKEGDRAPEVFLQDDAGGEFRLSAHAGRTVVLYFYPKSDTPGCTTEACEFRDEAGAFVKKGAVIVGISPDKVSAQAKFKTKYGLPFQLLADENHQAADAYGVWKEKSMYGKKYMGVERTTFVIGPDGRIARIFGKVKPKGHAAEVLSAV